MPLEVGSFLAANRFLVQRQLGEGGFGIVYQVYDQHQDEIVALKMLQKWNGEALYNLKQEFRSLADIIHPNLITLYELYSEETEWFFTMELVNGISFLDYIWEECTTSSLTNKIGSLTSHLEALQTLPTKIFTNSTINFIPQYHRNKRVRLNLPFLEKSLKQLAEGIFAIHQAGKLHCDIKPSNVLVTSDGEVKILDFGLVRELTRRNLSPEQIGAGTPAYMSPEQSLCGDLTEATDWYCLGVILYQSLTGQLPFFGSLQDILVNKLTHKPKHPKELFPDLPQSLSDLSMELLKPNAKDRPSGQEILAKFRELAAEPIKDVDKEDAYRISSQEIPFVGRQEELSGLKEAFSVVNQENKPITVFVHGSSGMGKSALTRYFLDQLQTTLPSPVILSGRCYQQESLPYKAFDGVIDSLSQYLKEFSEEKDLFIPKETIALARLFPVLEQVKEIAKATSNSTSTLSSNELRRQAFSALRQMLVWLTKQHSVVVYIDDLQWGDIDSVALITEIFSAPDPPALLLIATYRSEEINSSPVLKTLLPLAKNDKLAEVRQIEIGKFNIRQAQELIISLLNKNSLAAFSTNQLPLAKLLHQSSGSPFFIIELAKYLQTSDASNSGLQAFTSNTLDEALKHRISELPDKAKYLLEIIAIAGQPIKLEVLGNILKEKIKKHGILLPLRSSHLIRIRETQDFEEIETYHDRIRETILSYLDENTLKEYHLNLALALESDIDTDPERLINHFYQAQLYHKAYHYAVIAAAHADQTLAFDHASELYELALKLIIEHKIPVLKTEIHQTRVKLATALTNAGRGKQASEAYLLAAQDAINQEEFVDLKRRAAEELLISGHIYEGLDILNEVLNSVGLKLAKTRSPAFLSLLYNRLKIKIRGLEFNKHNVIDVDSFDLLKIDTCWSAALGLSMIDTVRGADFQSQHLLLALKAGEPYRIARALSFEAAYSSAAGGKTQEYTAELLAQAKLLAEESKHPHAIALNIFIYGFVAFMQGRWKDAYEFDSLAEPMFRNKCSGVQWEIDSINVNTLHNLLLLGRYTEASQRLPGLLNEAHRRGDIYGESMLLYRVSYMLHLANDKPEKAEKELSIVSERWSDKEFYQQHFLLLLAEIETALYSGKASLAWQFIKDKEPLLKKSFVLKAQILNLFWLYAFARSALAMFSSTKDNTFLRLAEEMAKKIQEESMPWSNPFAQVIYATIASHNKNSSQAIGLLKEASLGFELANMKLHWAITLNYQGKLLGDKGKSLLKEADEYLAEQKIKSPEKFSAMLIPTCFLS
ncbi:MAG: protein kinase [Acidobacteria bacterium]|nr:protein kinase [Acidobacteriota bacterium]